jgi:hypothetical protein
LHILAIGISEYGDKATSLRLKFAAKDANDVASALLATQGSEFNKKGGLYADVKPQYLRDGEADRAAIFRGAWVDESEYGQGCNGSGSHGDLILRSRGNDR